MTKENREYPWAFDQRRALFETKLKQGYNTIASATCELTDGKTIGRLMIFYHPEGRIATYEQDTPIDGKGSPINLPEKIHITVGDFLNYKKRFKGELVIVNRGSLESLLQD